MERIRNEEGIGSSSVREEIKLSIFEAIQQLARKHARQPIDTEEATMRFLISWWCKYYNRPMKDPLLKEYTVEELAYEYYNVIEREAFSVEVREREQDRIEEEAWNDAEAWADKMEQEEVNMKMKNNKKAKDYDPLTDPDEIAWMEKQMAIDREKFGDDFGEDLSMNFGDDDG